jgi:hypothetical protein
MFLAPVGGASENGEELNKKQSHRWQACAVVPG